MTLPRYLDEIGSHQDHLAYVAWLSLQWDKPDRHDHYLMQLALMSAQSKDAKLASFKLKFENKRVVPLSKAKARQQAADYAKAIMATRRMMSMRRVGQSSPAGKRTGIQSMSGKGGG